MKTSLEIIVMDAADARQAASGGATNLEVVRDLPLGGLTPDFDTLRAVRAAVDLPLNVMVRPHARDFVYSPAEADQILADAGAVTRLGADGVVFGALTSIGDVDVPLLYRVIETCRAINPSIQFTFHRAIEEAADTDSALTTLTGLVDRVLASGLRPGQGENRDLLGDWVMRYGAGIQFACGGGVTLENARHIFEATGVPEIHVGGAARTKGAVERVKVAAIVAALSEQR
ncbi:MAG: copper homeostasis protein CutC [Chloroflexi bacterium]|nr:copper homeostasis protein CutC [Chloroflexota bacterium]